MRNGTAVAVGGALGAPARYELALALPTSADRFPWTTFWINISGSFALGMLLTVVLERWPPTRYVRPFVAIGFLGAYTTFSTYAVETMLLGKRGHAPLGALYLLGSALAGLAAVYLGIVAGRAWPAVRRRRS